MESHPKSPPLSIHDNDDDETLTTTSQEETLSEISTHHNPLPKIKQEYKSVQDYQSTFSQIVFTEEKYQETAITSWIADYAAISWSYEGDILYGDIDLSESQRKGINLRENMILKVSSGKWSTEGIIKVMGDQQVTIACTCNETPPVFYGYFKVQCVWNSVVFERMRTGLLKFQNPDCMSPDIRSLLLGQESPQKTSEQPQSEPHVSEDYAELEKFGLNESQKQAAIQALNESSMFLIQGPPGTGKTSTITAIIAQLAYNLKAAKSHYKILVCAPSNTAVDELAIRLVREGVEGLSRMYSLTKETMRSEHKKLKDVALHNQIYDLGDERLNYLWDKKRDTQYLDGREWKEFLNLKKKHEQNIFKEQRIICCTCSTAADGRLDEFFFKYVFIDEAAQATEPECLLPLLFGVQKAVLAGDHKQLGPVINSPEARESNFDRTLFERLMKKANNTMLTMQYRMHSLIAELPSILFYDNKLETDRTIERKYLSEGANKIFQKPINFIELKDGEEERSGTSWINKIEANDIVKMVKSLLKSGIRAEDIGIITPYSGQKRLLIEKLHDDGQLKEKLKIASVDEFQGGERKYIIISTVRSNNYGKVGFLNDERRLNVAITRAKFGMIIYGNSRLLKCDESWKQLVKFYESKKVFYKSK